MCQSLMTLSQVHVAMVLRIRRKGDRHGRLTISNRQMLALTGSHIQIATEPSPIPAASSLASDEKASGEAPLTGIESRWRTFPLTRSKTWIVERSSFLANSRSSGEKTNTSNHL